MAKNVTLRDNRTNEILYPTTKAEFIYVGDETGATFMDVINKKIGPEGGRINGNLVVEGTLSDGSVNYVKSNDSRLSDARTPLAHTHAASDIPELKTVATTASYNDLVDTPDALPASNVSLDPVNKKITVSENSMQFVVTEDDELLEVAFQ